LSSAAAQGLAASQTRAKPPPPIIRRMQRLRQARTLARLVLAWFALTLGVALASPIAKPHAFQLVCSAAGSVQVQVQDGDGSQAPASHTLDCPMCAPVAPPPPIVLGAAPQAQPLSHAAQSIPAARLAARVAAPLPPRGPPSLA
jgi:hypothetical protein